jgi:hypothetical protein
VRAGTRSHARCLSAQDYQDCGAVCAGRHRSGGATPAQELAKDLGVSVIIENKPGAGTIIGTQAFATSAADGCGF